MEKVMKVGIVDDEIGSLELLETLVGRLPYFSVCLSSTDPVASLSQIQKAAPDIMVLDVQMAGLDGLAFAAELQAMHIPVILVSGKKLEAQDPFDLEVVDFVAKPVKIGRLTKALHKAKEWVELRQLKETTATRVKPNQDEFLMVRHFKYKGFTKLNVSQIDFIVGAGDRPEIMVENEKYYSDKSLNLLEEELRNYHFIRIHKSYLVNLRKIQSVDQEHVYFQQSYYDKIPIGRTYKEGFLEYFRERYVY
ncbi:response regulator transcription factor [Litoribacter ruber]|uniref:LytR/AlgR family response regulator transcription factor n=1 Tax=Litoribacter ruber TaxID=702568 RepID=UPI001BDB1A6D|nr:LytTR family DNA-binding domain-containing protein [Litoribacter ruber]MBT0812999.1 response regulator transcription factor [Litoribacter ruber]